MSRQCSGVSSRKPRAAPKPALANATSRRPQRSSARGDERLLLAEVGHVAGRRQRDVVAAELAGQRVAACPRCGRRARPGSRPRRRAGRWPRRCRVRRAGDEEDPRIGSCRASLQADALRQGAHIRAGRGRRHGCMSLPPRGARAARRARRRRRRPRRRGRAGLRRLAARPADVQAPGALQGAARRVTARAPAHGADGRGPRRPRAAGDAGARLPTARATTSSCPGTRARVARGGAGGRGNKQFATRHAPGAALRRARPAGRGGLGRAAAQAAGRRRPRRAAERGQVVAARRA